MPKSQILKGAIYLGYFLYFTLYIVRNHIISHLYKAALCRVPNMINEGGYIGLLLTLLSKVIQHVVIFIGLYYIQLLKIFNYLL